MDGPALTAKMEAYMRRAVLIGKRVKVLGKSPLMANYAICMIATKHRLYAVAVMEVVVGKFTQFRRTRTNYSILVSFLAN